MFTALLTAMLFVLPACVDGASSTPDPTDNDTGDTSEPDTETAADADCEDGVDNDDDGLADCDDPDCTTAFVCTWPDAINHRTDISFEGYDVECDLGIFGSYDVEVDDCQTIMTSPLTVTTDGSLCTECDRTYAGAFTVEQDTCDDLTGDGHRPSEARFGFVFRSETERELWSEDSGGQWAPAITMTLENGMWRHSDSGEVDYEYDDCENSPLNIGLLTVSLEFTDQ